jgi:hypothetical protein
MPYSIFKAGYIRISILYYLITSGYARANGVTIPKEQNFGLIPFQQHFRFGTMAYPDGRVLLPRLAVKPEQLALVSPTIYRSNAWVLYMSC